MVKVSVNDDAGEAGSDYDEMMTSSMTVLLILFWYNDVTMKW